MWADLEQEYAGQIEFFEIDRETREGREFRSEHDLPLGQPAFVVKDSAGLVTYAALGPYDERGLRELVASALEEG